VGDRLGTLTCILACCAMSPKVSRPFDMRPEDVPADVAEVLEAKTVVLAFGAFIDNSSCVRSSS
jgi:hypothetical protein